MTHETTVLQTNLWKSKQLSNMFEKSTLRVIGGEG